MDLWLSLWCEKVITKKEEIEKDKKKQNRNKEPKHGTEVSLPIANEELQVRFFEKRSFAYQNQEMVITFLNMVFKHTSTKS